MKKEKSKKRLNKYIRFTGIGFQIGITMYLAAYFGEWLDHYFSMKEKVFTLLLIIVSLAATIWSITVQLKDIDKD